MTDLWITASQDMEAEASLRLLTAAREGVASYFALLLSSGSQEDYENRKALIADRLDAAVASLTGQNAAAYVALRGQLEASLDADFDASLSAREAEVEQRREALVRKRVRGENLRRSEAAVRARVQAETQRRTAALSPRVAMPPEYVKAGEFLRSLKVGDKVILDRAPKPLEVEVQSEFRARDFAYEPDGSIGPAGSYEGSGVHVGFGVGRWNTHVSVEQQATKNRSLGYIKERVTARKTAQEDDEEIVTVTRVVRDEGTVVVFEGTDSEGDTRTFAADHRMAQAIVDALEAGQSPQASVPSWSFLGKRATLSREAAVSTHVFSSTGEAYNQSQVDADIKDGDVLAVPSEGVFGFLYEAWPIAVTADESGVFSQPGDFHEVQDKEAFLTGNPKYRDSWEQAASLARQHMGRAGGADPFVGSREAATEAAGVDGAGEPETGEWGEPEWEAEPGTQTRVYKGYELVVEPSGFWLSRATSQVSEYPEVLDAGLDPASSVEEAKRLAEHSVDSWVTRHGSFIARRYVVSLGYVPASLRRQSKDYDTATRREYADKGWALSDGSYPIADCGDVKDAINRAHQGNADEGTIKAHIKKRWSALGCGGTEPFSTSQKAASVEAEIHAPYRIKEIDGKFFVVNDNGEKKSNEGFDTWDQAREHQKALYANVEGAPEMAKEKKDKREGVRAVSSEGLLCPICGEPVSEEDGDWQPGPAGEGSYLVHSYHEREARKQAAPGARKHLLLTEDLRRQLPPLYSTEEIPVEDKTLWVKFFTPFANWTWYAAEFDGTDTFFGYVKGDFPEWGYFSLSELDSITGPGGMPGVERDTGWRPITFDDLQHNPHLGERKIAGKWYDDLTQWSVEELTDEINLWRDVHSRDQFSHAQSARQAGERIKALADEFHRRGADLPLRGASKDSREAAANLPANPFIPGLSNPSQPPWVNPHPDIVPDDDEQKKAPVVDEPETTKPRQAPNAGGAQSGV